MKIDLTQIILGIITLLSGVITSVLVPYLKSKLTERQQEILKNAIDIGVYAAEQLYGSGHGEEKKTYVRELLNGKGYDVNMEEVNAAIEAAVKQLKITAGE